MIAPPRVILATFLSLGLLCAGPIVSARAADDIRVERVSFATGASNAVIEGRIEGYQTIDYLLRGQEGQYMKIGLAADNGASYFNVLAPGETEVAFFNGSVSGSAYEGRLPASGDYRIRVYLMRSAARRNEVANYRLEITVDGAAAGSSGNGIAGGDARVPGTDFHAAAQVPCAAESGKPMSRCDAGVKRVGGGGTVYITMPDGGRRVIVFHDGKVVSTNADGSFRTERRGDWTVVRIGAVEVYEIPDAFVSGG